MSSSDDPVLNIKQIAEEIFPGTAESTVNGWARGNVFGKPAGKVGRGNVWYRSRVIQGATAAGKLDANGEPTSRARGRGGHRKAPEGPQYDEDGMRLRTRAQVLAMFGVPSKRSQATVAYRWMSQGLRGFPKTPDTHIGVNPLWRDDTLTRWADSQGIDYDLSAEPSE